MLDVLSFVSVHARKLEQLNTVNFHHSCSTLTEFDQFDQLRVHVTVHKQIVFTLQFQLLRRLVSSRKALNVPTISWRNVERHVETW